jgi:muramoyltetrapeptide carboxypeptidase
MEDIFNQTFKCAALIAPAGKAEKNNVDIAVEMLEKAGLQVKVMPNVFSPGEGKYLSAPLKARLQDLHACWRDKSVDLIFCVRGGFGSAHLLPHINWDLLRTRQIPLIGYSDITALHMGMLVNKVGTPVVAPMPNSLKEALEDDKAKDYTRHFMSLALAEHVPAGTELVPPEGEKFKIVKDTYALGLPIPANLSVLASLCGTPYMPKMRNKILILEDINEPVYKLDRYLTQLDQCGILKKCQGVLFGKFTNCGTEEERSELFRRFSKKINGTVISGFPFGHGFPLMSINTRRHLRIEKNGKIYLIDT